jgi:hypothetical protein
MAASAQLDHLILRVMIEKNPDKLGGVVEIDETFRGGKAYKKHNKDHDGRPGGTASGKKAVVGVVPRHGRVVARVIADVCADTLTPSDRLS